MLFLLHDSFILDSSTRFIHHEIEIWTIIQQLQKLLEILFVSFKKTTWISFTDVHFVQNYSSKTPKCNSYRQTRAH